MSATAFCTLDRALPLWVAMAPIAWAWVSSPGAVVAVVVELVVEDPPGDAVAGRRVGHRRGTRGFRGTGPGVRAVQRARGQQTHAGRQQGDEHARRHHQPAPGPLRADHDRGVDRAVRSGPAASPRRHLRARALGVRGHRHNRGGVVGRSPAHRGDRDRGGGCPLGPPGAERGAAPAAEAVARTRLESAVRAGNHRRSGYRPPGPVQDRWRRPFGPGAASRAAAGPPSPAEVPGRPEDKVLRPDAVRAHPAPEASRRGEDPRGTGRDVGGRGHGGSGHRGCG